MIICFDTETTGFSKEKDDLLQISVVNENCEVVFESYIRPETKTSWNSAYKVNRISYDMVKDAPTIQELKPIIQELFDSAEKIVGYNVGFDVGFIESKFKFDIDKSKVVDCLKSFKDEEKKLGLNLDRHKLINAVEFYCPEAKEEYQENAHDASCDSIATMRVYQAQLDSEAKRHFIVPTISEETQELVEQMLEDYEIEL